MRHSEVNALADSCVLKADKQTMSTETSVGSLGRVFAVKDVSVPPPEFQEGEKVTFQALCYNFNATFDTCLPKFSVAIIFFKC